VARRIANHVAARGSLRSIAVCIHPFVPPHQVVDTRGYRMPSVPYRCVPLEVFALCGSIQAQAHHETVSLLYRRAHAIPREAIQRLAGAGRYQLRRTANLRGHANKTFQVSWHRRGSDERVVVKGDVRRRIAAVYIQRSQRSSSSPSHCVSIGIGSAPRIFLLVCSTEPVLAL
jgi:hypothetical protein